MESDAQLANTNSKVVNRCAELSLNGRRLILSGRPFCTAINSLMYNEGSRATINDRIVISSSTGEKVRVLQIDDMTQDTTTSGTVTFNDVATGETQKITLTSTNGGTIFSKSGVNVYGATGLNIYMVSTGGRGGPASMVSITWGTGSSPNNIGTEQDSFDCGNCA